MQERILHEAEEALTAESKIVDWMVNGYKEDGLNADLLKGFIKIPSTEILNLPGSGATDGLPLYISTTAGHFDFSPPSASGDFVRVVGYCIDDDSSDILLYFNPDPTWVEIR